MVNTTALLPAILPNEPPALAVIIVILKGSSPITITNLPFPVWIASEGMASGDTSLYAAEADSVAATGVADVLGVSTVTCVLGVITVVPEFTSAVSVFFSSFFSTAGALAAVLALRASVISTQRSSTKSTVFLRHLARPRTSLVLDLFKAYLSVIHSSAVYFSFPSR